MSTPIDNEKYPPSGDGAKLPGLASPSTDINQLRTVVDGLKEIVEVREGRRGSRYDQVVTWRDLYNVGLVAVQSGGNTYINQTNSGGVSAVTLLAPNLQALMASEFDKKVKASAAYKDLTTEIGVAASYKGAPQEVIDILTTNLSDESIKRGADIRTVQTKIQEVDKSLALSVRELTAGIDSAQASVREVMYSSVNRDEATAGAVTTVNARLNNFGGGGVTVEQKMTATVNRVTGLEGIYSVKIVIDNNGTPYISGFALSSTVTAGGAATSSFVVNASNFAIYRPGTTSVAPFGVDTVNNEVFINGTLRINTGGTTINTVSATATSANSTANTANGTANSALSLATTANGTANSATSTLTTKLNKAGADVLTGPISLQASDTILVGTTNDGVAMGSSGIIGRKAGVTTFSVAADGTAIFSGSVTAGSIIAGGVTIGVGGTALSSVESNASTALSTASAANSNATTALSTASAANSNATTALVAANSAQGTANTANSAASAAQGTANTANSNASTALSTANAANSNANTAIASVANKLDSNARNVLGGYGGLATGTLNWDSSGNRTSGYGVGLTAAGLAAFNSSGATTFVLNGTTGDAAFAGNLSGASGTFSGTLTALAINAVNTINIAGNAVTVPLTVTGAVGTAFGYGTQVSIKTSTAFFPAGGTITALFTALKTQYGAGDIEVILNVLNSSNTLIATFAGAGSGALIQTMGPPGDKVTAIFTGTYTVAADDNYKIEAIVSNPYGNSWISDYCTVIALGSKR